MKNGWSWKYNNALRVLLKWRNMPKCSDLIDKHFKYIIQIQNLMLLLWQDFWVFLWIMNFYCYQVTITRTNRFNLWGSKCLFWRCGLWVTPFQSLHFFQASIFKENLLKFCLSLNTRPSKPLLFPTYVYTTL